MSLSRNFAVFLFALLFELSRGFQFAPCTCQAPISAPTAATIDDHDHATVTSDRRSFVSAATVFAMAFVASPRPALAGIDPTALKAIPVEGDVSGAASRVRQLQTVDDGNAKPEDLIDVPFAKLPSGVSYREYRSGTGVAVVQPGSKVAVEMTIRCKSFATANEPGGVKYFTTKGDTDFNEYAFTVGYGETLPGLEEGMMGMRKNGIRRIEVPSVMVFAARNSGQLPVPSEKNKDGKRIFERLFKTDATLLFEVKVVRIK